MHTRMLRSDRSRSIVLLAVALVFSAAAAAPVRACSCAEPPDVATCVANARAVFLGTVTSIETVTEGPFVTIEAVFSVEKTWKGVAGPEARVVTSESSASCGYGFEFGVSYVVYANVWPNTDGPLRTSLCSRTHATYEGDPEIPLLGTPSLPTSWGALKAGYR